LADIGERAPDLTFEQIKEIRQRLLTAQADGAPFDVAVEIAELRRRQEQIQVVTSAVREEVVSQPQVNI